MIGQARRRLSLKYKILTAAALLFAATVSAHAQVTPDNACQVAPYQYQRACVEQELRARNQLDDCEKHPYTPQCADKFQRARDQVARNGVTAWTVCYMDPYGDACTQRRTALGDASALEEYNARHAAAREAQQKIQAELNRQARDPNRPIAPLVADGQLFVRLFTGKMQVLRTACRADLPGAPPNDACQMVEFAKGFDTAALTDGINNLDQHSKNCLFIGVSRGQVNVPAACGVENDNRAVNYAAALAIILTEPVR